MSEEELCRRIQQVCGRVPVGTSDLLRVLVHPDVIELTKAYVDFRHEELKRSICLHEQIPDARAGRILCPVLDCDVSRASVGDAWHFAADVGICKKEVTDG